MPGISTAECPVSAIRPESIELVDLYESANGIEGVSLYGPDLSAWPARMVEVVRALNAESALIEQYRSTAV